MSGAVAALGRGQTSLRVQHAPSSPSGGPAEVSPVQDTGRRGGVGLSVPSGMAVSGSGVHLLVWLL